MKPSLDPLRYGRRALDEMAREQASVVPPPPPATDHFSPHPVLRPAAREGAALSLRLFSDADDDATSLVVGNETSRRFSPVPARAAALFDAHAAVLAAEGDDAITMGFPLVTFSQQGSMRAAPLFSRGGVRARWTIGDAPWRLKPGVRDGATIPPPDGLVLEVGDEAPYALHAGIWHSLFGLDGAALGGIAAAGRASTSALVRAATRALASGEEDDGAEAAGSEPLTREDLVALAEAATARAGRSRAFRFHAHGLAMLPPRGDPTSALRSDLDALLDLPLPPRGPLAVFLGAPAGPPHRSAVFSAGTERPTPSQLEAARAFEGAEDIVVVRGPPGCGKTALVHQVARQTVVACALGKVWSTAPSRAAPWALVVTSTNNAAVDQALAPFVSRTELPVALRLGSRRTLADTTAAALTASIELLEAPPDLSLAAAREAFEACAAPVRAFERERTEGKKARGAATERRRALEARATALREELARSRDATPTPLVDLAELEAAERALRDHGEAASKLAALHLDGAKASTSRATEKWARANALRGPRIEPMLRALHIETPFRELDRSCPREDIARQEVSIAATLASLADVRAALSLPARRAELADVEAALAVIPSETSDPPLDPALYDAALALRHAWAHHHRSVLLPRLAAARDAVRGDGSAARGKPLALVLREIAVVFPVAGCTLLSMRASFPLERDVIDRLVVDEAAQCAPIYAVPALARARRAMMTGDTAQLPPVYTLDPRVDDRLARGLDEAAIAPFRMSAISTSSAQATAEPRARVRLSLVEHFRSQPAIVALASRFSGYTLDVRTEPSSLTDVSPRLAHAVEVVAVRGVGARAPEGVVNEAEAAYAVDLVATLARDGVAPADIAVLTPFVGQSVRIERELDRRGLLSRGGVLVSTVHRLQGGERRVVVFSVTATARRHLRWLGERPHLLHVATSRARDHLVVILDPAAASEPFLASFDELLHAGGV